MNLVDSSGWLEYLSDGPNASFFEKPLGAPGDLIVPTLCLYEVFKVVLRERGESDAIQAAALMQQSRLAELTGDVALLAARLSLKNKIPMADSIIAATAALYKAVIWTQDEDFKVLEGVKYISKKKK
ncbi:MAG: type II toxin-antitoxin system VapC family toxin [Candidatus Aminicenantes bacterium]|nr:type II toxin-antitoxin system VapC family toxin [Candidatus Aminicenantes bacterium]